LLSLLLLVSSAALAHAQTAPPAAGEAQRNSVPRASSAGIAPDPAQLFQQGQDALNGGRLDEAEQVFRRVLALNPQVAGAYANLGVVYMRRKQWTKALEMLRQAEQMMPQVAGIRLNIGLAYFRQNEFLKAIPPSSQSCAISPTRCSRGICSASATSSQSDGPMP
jgi:Flp pilus assembly protein TadD